MNWKLGMLAVLGLTCVGCNKNAAQAAKSDAPEVTPVAHVTIVGCVQPSTQPTDTNYTLTRAQSSNGRTPTSANYRLDAKDATLSPEVGHQVEIVALAPAPDPSGQAPKVKVETIRMIATTCPQ